MPTTATPNLLTDPGYLFWAPLSSTEPANTVVANKFTDAWPVAWISLGATEAGSEFSYNIKLDMISVAEFFDPIKWVTTERTGSFAFNLTDYTLTALKKVMNAGTATNVISGVASAGTQLSSLSPPTPGSEIRAMLGWESLDSTVRVVVYQAINGGAIKTSFKKAPAYATMPCTFNFEIPTAGLPFKIYSAGTVRA